MSLSIGAPRLSSRAGHPVTAGWAGVLIGRALGRIPAEDNERTGRGSTHWRQTFTALEAWARSEPYEPRANSRAQYEMITSAPARRMEVSASRIALSSSHPRSMAAMIAEYSPDT